jgi:hypothetical protein
MPAFNLGELVKMKVRPRIGRVIGDAIWKTGVVRNR